MNNTREVETKKGQALTLRTLAENLEVVWRRHPSLLDAPIFVDGEPLKKAVIVRPPQTDHVIIQRTCDVTFEDAEGCLTLEVGERP